MKKAGGTEDERTTWTGKRIRGDGRVEGAEGGAGGVGKYLKVVGEGKGEDEDEIVGDWGEDEPVVKKVKIGGGFGNFDSW